MHGSAVPIGSHCSSKLPQCFQTQLGVCSNTALRHRLPPSRPAGLCRLKWHFCDRSAEVNSKPPHRPAVQHMHRRSVCMQMNEEAFYRMRLISSRARLNCSWHGSRNTIACHRRARGQERRAADAWLQAGEMWFEKWPFLQGTPGEALFHEKQWVQTCSVPPHPHPSKMVIEINIIPRATFVYKQCPYCSPARSWKWNKAFNELAALSPGGLPRTRTQTERGRGRDRERGENIFATWESEWDTRAKQH